MATIKPGPDSVPAAFVEVGRSLLGFTSEVVGACLWRSVAGLPWSLIKSLAACTLATALTAWMLASTGLDLFDWTWLLVALALHAAAGVVWSTQQTLDVGAKEGLRILESRIPELTDLLLAPLVRMCDDRVPQFELAEIRAHVQLTCGLALNPQQSSWWGRRAVRLTGWAARWLLRAQLALVERALTAFERRGETHLSLDSLKNVVRDEAITRSKTVALANLWQAELAAAAVVFLLLVAPAMLATLLV